MELKDLGNLYDMLDAKNPDRIHIFVHAGQGSSGMTTSNLHSNQSKEKTLLILRECVKEVERQLMAERGKGELQ